MFGSFLVQVVRAVVGFMLAIFVAAVILVYRWYGAGSGPEGVSGLDVVSWMLASLALLPLIGAATFLPALVLIAAAELFRWRHILLFVVAGGVFGALAGTVSMPSVEVWSGSLTDGTIVTAAGESPADPDPFRFVVAGLAGGLAYWLIAGKASGIWRDLLRPD